jgi:hypothetical protein
MVIFVNSQGIIHKEFVPPGQIVNKEYYVEVLSCLFQRIRQVRPRFQGRGSWFLLQDNTRPHTTLSTKQFLAKQGIPQLNNDPYSPDLSSPVIFLFPKIKFTQKGRKFDDTKDIKRIVTKELLALNANEIKKCFQQFHDKRRSV